MPRWVLSVFLALLFSTLVLILFSASIIWDLEADTMYPVDLWLLSVAGLCLWGLLGGAPVHLRRDWYEHQLALCILLGIVFGFATTLETLETGATPAALTVATVGASGPLVQPSPWSEVRFGGILPGSPHLCLVLGG